MDRFMGLDDRLAIHDVPDRSHHPASKGKDTDRNNDRDALARPLHRVHRRRLGKCSHPGAPLRRSNSPHSRTAAMVSAKFLSSFIISKPLSVVGARLGD